MTSGDTPPQPISVPDAPAAGSRSSTVIKLKAIEKDITTDHENVQWIHTAQAEGCFGAVVFLNACWIGIDIEFNTGDTLNWGFWSVETTFLIIFIVEIIMRVIAESKLPEGRWFNYFNKSGLFDCFIVGFGCLDAWVFTLLQHFAGSSSDSPFSSLTVLRVFRLVRLIRLVRVLRMFGELVVLIQTLGGSIKAVGWMSLLLFMILYASSIFTVLQIGQSPDAAEEAVTYYGDLPSALFSHFCIVCLEGWTGIADAARQHHWGWGIYMILMVILTNFALVNLMVGVIVERIIHHSLEQENDLSSFVAESAQFHKTLATLFASGDMDHSGDVSCQEVRDLLQDKRTREIMSVFGINLNIPAATLHTIMKLNKEGDVLTTFEDFVASCMRLCGSKQSGHWIFVQYDICEAQQDLTGRLGILEKQLSQVGAKVHKQLQEACAPPPMITGPGRPGFSNPSGAGPLTQGLAVPPGSNSVVVPLPLKLTGIERETLTELNTQMDDLAKMQKLVLNELEAVKVQRLAKVTGATSAAGRSSGASGRSRRSSSGERSSPSKSVELATRAPRDLGGCCTLGSMWRSEPSPEK